MIFSNDGTVTSYKPNGDVIHSSDFVVSDYNPDRNNGWDLGKLAAPGILFPYSINTNGAVPAQFSIMYIDEDNLTLVDDKSEWVGDWGEITYWVFKTKN